MSITSRRIDKCPTPKQRFSDKFPTARTDKMTNSWQIPTGDGHAWNWLSHYHYHLKQIFVSFHWPRAHHVTCKQLPTNNGLLMRNVACLPVFEIGKQSIQYRGPTIWTFLNRLININETISKDKFKQILRRFSKDINNFSFRAPMIANKHNDYVYF